MPNEDLKKEDQTSEGGGQPEAKGTPEIEELKAQLAKEREEKENYRLGLLSAKAKKTSLSDEEEPKKEVPKEEDESWQEVERRAKRIAEAEFEARDKRQAKLNEQIALKSFMQKHPELMDDALRSSVIEEYSPKHGKSVDGIALDLERAYKLFKLDNNITDKVEVKPDLTNLAKMPTGEGKSNASPAGFNEFEQEVMTQYQIKPELFKAWKDKVLSGQMTVPDEVFTKLSKS